MNADASVNAHQSRQVFKTFTGEVGIVTKGALSPDCIEEKASVQSGDVRSCLHGQTDPVACPSLDYDLG
jgi:hypothetical protein